MKKYKRTSLFALLGVVICFVVTLACILTGNYVNQGYDVEVGSVSPVKIVAPREIENTFATEKKRQEAAASVSPLYMVDQSVSVAVRENLLALFSQLEERKAAVDSVLGIAGDAVTETGEESEESTPSNIEIVASDILISDEQLNIYRLLPRATRINLRDTVIELADAIMENGVKEEPDAKSLLNARNDLNDKPWPADAANLAYSILTAALKPNWIINEEGTAAATEAKIAQVVPVMVLEGQKIVDEGEIITEEIYSLLLTLDMVSSNTGGNYIEIAGTVAIVILFFAVFIVYMRFFYSHIVGKELVLFCILYSFAIIMMRLMSSLTFYIIPLTIPVMLIAVLIDQRLAVLSNIMIVFIGTLIYKGSPEFLMYFIITGSFSVLVSQFTFERAKIIFSGLIICAVNAAVVAGINMFYYKTISPEAMFSAVIAVSNGLLSLLIAVGSLPIWEAAFDIITPVKLLDLTNPNNVLLRRLTIEAPGTYHHSLIVANLAEQAAYDIGANASLARVGGYYHDIGKLKYPYYYGENQVGENPHDRFDPYDSARLIMQHVPLGVEFADTYKLPKAIRDIIFQHHGTTLVQFFYIRAQDTYSVEYVKEEDFRYKGVIPKGRESAIVMLADTAEAAVRSMISSSKSMAEVETFIRQLIKNKLDDNQLDDSMLTLTDLGVIRKAFMKVFRGMYHERVKYPDKESSLTERGTAKK